MQFLLPSWHIFFCCVGHVDGQHTVHTGGRKFPRPILPGVTFGLQHRLGVAAARTSFPPGHGGLACGV